jgi:hypothetical protein
MDNLEKFIKGNRTDLDKYEPPKSAWRRISNGLRNRRPSIPGWLYVAATVIVILGFSVLIYSLNRPKNYNYSEGNTGSAALKETEVYYNSLVNTLYSEAKPFLTGQPEIASELRTDMARNYRIKLQLLEDMLKLLRENENKSEKSKSHEL